MRSTAAIAFDVTGQTLRHTVLAGRPSAATYAVYAADAGDDDDPEWSGTATIDAVNTTTASAAGPAQLDPTLIEVSSATGLVAGRAYLLSDNGKREWVTVAEIDDTDVFVTAALRNDYASGAAFASCDLTASVDATWVADSANLGNPASPNPAYRVRWAVTVGGATQIELTFFTLARGAVGHGVTLADVEARLWNVLEDIPSAHRADQGQRMIAAAWEDVQAMLAGTKLNDAAVRDAALVDQLLLKQIRLTYAMNGYYPRGMSPDLAIRTAQEDLERFFERRFIAGEVPVATTSNAAAPKRGRAWVR